LARNLLEGSNGNEYRLTFKSKMEELLITRSDMSAAEERRSESAASYNYADVDGVVSIARGYAESRRENGRRVGVDSLGTQRARWKIPELIYNEKHVSQRGLRNGKSFSK
jgi:hypothetical protein